MKYYCENCGTEVKLGPKITDKYCFCSYCLIKENGVQIQRQMKPLPDYETPDQYKARIGKELSGEAQVWLRLLVGNKPEDTWRRCGLEQALLYKSSLDGKNYSATAGDARIYHVQILIGGPEPPPDNYGS
jgi:hypothetical protein